MTCVFCQIVSGQEPRHHVWEDERFMVFLTRRPLKPGHLLIIPKAHVDYFFDMEHDLYRGIFEVARMLEPKLKRVTKAVRIGLAVEGFGVGHAHLHLIPMFKRGGLDSFLAYNASEDELRTMSEQLRLAFR